MFCIVDARIPEQAKLKLSEFATVISFQKDDYKPEYLSGHPDVFLFQYRNNIVIAPEIEKFADMNLSVLKCTKSKGYSKVDADYPGCTAYNAAIGDTIFIHNLQFTDKAVESLTAGMRRINVKQGFSRCSTIHLGKDCFITSDKSIMKSLDSAGIECEYLSPEGIILKGCRHGLLGGTAGVLGDKLFLCGNADFYPEGTALRHITEARNITLIELYEGPLIDCGGIFFCE